MHGDFNVRMPKDFKENNFSHQENQFIVLFFTLFTIQFQLHSSIVKLSHCDIGIGDFFYLQVDKLLDKLLQKKQ